ncbi:MAG TPA: glycosyltransferase family 39 protein [Elusimicrobiales bacterium]|nr:glycosyltransferase family 39 protein [Elusimicrobiales bacterium]
MLAILAAALALRLWAIMFGLPHTEARPDESTVIYIALRALLFDPSPASLVYPTGYTYLLSGVYAVYAFICRLFGAGPGVAGLLGEYAASPATLFVLNRLLVAFMGVATVYAVYKIAFLRAGHRAGLLAGLLMAVCYLHVRDSHFGTLDVPMTFFLVLSVLFMARWPDAPTIANYLAAGAFAGLAVGVKYVGILLAVHGLAAHWAASRNIKFKALILDRKIWLFELALLAGFFVSTPHAFLSFNQLAADFSYHKNLHGVMHGSNLLHHLVVSLNYGLGWPVLLAGLAGFIWCAAAQLRLFALLFPFVLLYFFAIDKVNSGYVRYAVPLLPFFCLSAALLAERLLQTIKDSSRRKATALLAVFLAGLSLYNSVRFDLLLSRPDSRNEAAASARALIPDGASVALLCGAYGCPLFPWQSAFFQRGIAREQARGNDFKADLYKAWDKYYSEAAGPRYARAEFDSGENIFRLVSGQEVGPDWVVVERSHLKDISALPTGAAAALRGYAPAFSIEAADLSCTGSVYDQEDAFYVPYRGFQCVNSPGPNIYFFKRR